MQFHLFLFSLVLASVEPSKPTFSNFDIPLTAVSTARDFYTKPPLLEPVLDLPLTPKSTALDSISERTYSDHSVYVLSQTLPDVTECPILKSDTSPEKAIKIRNDARISTIFSIEFVENWFIQRKINKHPLNNRKLTSCELERIKIYSDYLHTFPDKSPILVTHEEVGEIFLEFLRQGQNPESKEALFLRRTMTFDSCDAFFSHVNGDPSHYAEVTADDIMDKEIGTWTIRPSSIAANIDREIYIRTLSYVNNGQQSSPRDGKLQPVTHRRIIHVFGFGYCQLLPSYADKTKQTIVDPISKISKHPLVSFTSLENFDFFNSKFINKCFPSLLDLLLELVRIGAVDLSKHYRMQREESLESIDQAKAQEVVVELNTKIQNEMALINNEIQLNIKEIPSNINETPSNINETPSNLNETPSNLNETPSNVNEIRSIIEIPLTSNEDDFIQNQADDEFCEINTKDFSEPVSGEDLVDEDPPIQLCRIL